MQTQTIDLKDLVKNDNKNYNYYFRKESRIKLDGNKVIQELKEIAKNNVTDPKDVLQYAKENKSSEIAKGLEWDDSIAADKYRLQQITQIIYNLRVEIIENKEDETIKTITLTPYTHIRGETGYRFMANVYQEPELWNKKLKQAYQDLLYWKRKYSDFVEFEKIYEDIKELEDLFN